MSWRIEGHRGEAKIIGAGVNDYGDGPERYVGYFEAAPDDLTLVLAAPDLLAACKRILNHPLIRLTDDVEPALIAAIAKAEGR